MKFYKIIASILMIFLAINFSFAQKKKIEKPVYLQYVVDNADLKKTENKYERLKQQSVGHFSNIDYITPYSEEVSLDFIIIPIFQDKVGEYWVYMEYFPTALPERPLEQRIYQFVKENRDTTHLFMYHLKSPETYVNEWKKEMPFTALSVTDDLIRTPACDAYIIEQETQAHQYHVLPVPDGCPLLHTSGDATKAKTSYDISDMGYQMCIDFLNDEGEVVKPCPINGIFFRRMDYTALNYEALGPIIEIKKTKKKKPKKEKKERPNRKKKRKKG